MSELTGGPSRAPRIRPAIARHWLLALSVGVLVALGVLAAAQFLVPTTYTATTEVLVNPLAGNPLAPTQRSDQLTTLPTEALLVKSDAVEAQLTSDGSSVPANPHWRSKVTVTNPPNTSVVDVAFTATTPTAAARGADAIALAYLQTRTNRATAATATALASLQQSRSTASIQLSQAAQQLAEAKNGSSQYTVLVERVSGLSGQIAALDQQISDVKSGAGDAGNILSPATTPAKPDGPPLSIVLVAAIVIGALCGVAAAVWRERRTGVFRGVADVTDLGNPIISLTERLGPQELATPMRDPDRRAMLALVAEPAGHPCQYVVAPVEEDGIHSLATAASVAQALGIAGNDVVLLDETAPGAGRELGYWSGTTWHSSTVDGQQAPAPATGYGAATVLIAACSPQTAAGKASLRGRDGTLLVVDPDRTRRRSLVHALRSVVDGQGGSTTSPVLVIYRHQHPTGSRRKSRAVVQPSVP